MLRRIYLVLLSLILIAILGALLLDPQTVVGWAGQLSEVSVALRIPVGIILGTLLVVLGYFAVRPGPRPSVNGLQMQGSGALTEVSVDSARQRILKVVGDVPDVVAVETDVKPVRGRADVELQVTVWGHEVNLPAKQKEIDRALSQVINKQLGLKLAGKPRVHLRFHGEEEKKAIPIIPPILVSPQKSSIGANTVASARPAEPVNVGDKPFAVPAAMTVAPTLSSQIQTPFDRAQPVISVEEDADTLILDTKKEPHPPLAADLQLEESSKDEVELPGAMVERVSDDDDGDDKEV